MARKKKNSISIEILNAYKEYIDSGYPADPNIYELRVSPETYRQILNLSEDLQHSPYPSTGKKEKRFIWFRVKTDKRLGDGEILFGPQVLDFKL